MHKKIASLLFLFSFPAYPLTLKNNLGKQINGNLKYSDGDGIFKVTHEITIKDGKTAEIKISVPPYRMPGKKPLPIPLQKIIIDDSITIDLTPYIESQLKGLVLTVNRDQTVTASEPGAHQPSSAPAAPIDPDIERKKNN